MVFSYLEAVTFLASFVFVFWEISRETSQSFRVYYESKKDRMRCKCIPSWVFGVVWIPLKILIALALFYYLRNNAEVTVEIFTLWVVNEVLRKMWPAVFRDYERPGWAILVSAAIFGTGVALLVFLGLGEHYLSMGLMVAYVAWSGFAVYLNWDWYTSGPMKPTAGSSVKWKSTV